MYIYNYVYSLFRNNTFKSCLFKVACNFTSHTISSFSGSNTGPSSPLHLSWLCLMKYKTLQDSVEVKFNDILYRNDSFQYI